MARNSHDLTASWQISAMSALPTSGLRLKGELVLAAPSNLTVLPYQFKGPSRILSQVILQMLVMSAGHDLAVRQPQFVASPTRNYVHPIGGMAAHVIMVMM
jgi:hypothetical protein